jgi:hypothetical protein
MRRNLGMCMRRSKDHLGKWQRAIGQVAASDWANGSKREADQHRLSIDENGHAPTDVKT